MDATRRPGSTSTSRRAGRAAAPGAEDALETVGWVTGFEFPEHACGTDLLALSRPGSYAIEQGTLATRSGLSFPLPGGKQGPPELVSGPLVPSPGRAPGDPASGCGHAPAAGAKVTPQCALWLCRARAFLLCDRYKAQASPEKGR